MLSCWYSGTRTRCCAATSAGCGMRRPTERGFAALARLIPACAGPKSSLRRQRHCSPGTASWPRRSMTRAGSARRVARRQSRASPALPSGWRRRIRCGDTAASTVNDQTRVMDAQSPLWEILRVRASTRSAPLGPTWRQFMHRPKPRGSSLWTSSTRIVPSAATVRPGIHRAWHPPDASRRRHRHTDRRMGNGGAGRPCPHPRRGVRGYQVPNLPPRIQRPLLFDAVFQAAGTRILRSAVQAPRMKPRVAYCTFSG